MARVLPPRWRTLAFLAVVVPLWSSILVRIFGVAADYPFGAALASLTLVTLMGFLFISRRAGALENL
ncbi:MAG: hypothetical protein ACRDLS_00140 [Solirubrobacteraceae bacterium]